MRRGGTGGRGGEGGRRLLLSLVHYSSMCYIARERVRERRGEGGTEKEPFRTRKEEEARGIRAEGPPIK